MRRLVSPTSKLYMEMLPDESASLKGKGCKKGHKKDISANDMKDFINKEKQFEVKQNRIILEVLNMKTIEDSKRILNKLSNKKIVCHWLNKKPAWGYKGKFLEPLLKLFRNYAIPSRKGVYELLNIYPVRYFNFNYLEQYWKIDQKNFKL